MTSQTPARPESRALAALILAVGLGGGALVLFAAAMWTIRAWIASGRG